MLHLTNSLVKFLPINLFTFVEQLSLISWLTINFKVNLISVDLPTWCLMTHKGHQGSGPQLWEPLCQESQEKCLNSFNSAVQAAVQSGDGEEVQQLQSSRSLV